MLFIVILIVSCNRNPQPIEQDSKEISFEIKSLSDREYPDNPDIGFRAKNYQNKLFTTGIIKRTNQPFYRDFIFYTQDADSIVFNNLNIEELIPTIPENIKSNDYLCQIACINQEWNRDQVRFNPSEFETNKSELVRVDIARNCLNAYLWEIILYVKQDGKVLPYSHGWFDFPHELYAELFEKKNKIPYKQFQASLENWIEPEKKVVELSLLRLIKDSLNITYQDLSNNMYPLEGARKKKFKEIIFPTTFATMRDLQTDSTLLATFSPPGFYDTNDPRTTELGRIYKLIKINIYSIKATSSTKQLYEIRCLFSHKITGEKTQLVIGGIDFKDFPVLNPSKANSGWKSSMGIGNHTFYESYEENISTKSKNSPYYALLLDAKGDWLDSHKIGIDGPIFHFSDTERKTLHLWLLSFERHALVGHYKIDIKN